MSKKNKKNISEQVDDDQLKQQAEQPIEEQPQVEVDTDDEPVNAEETPEQSPEQLLEQKQHDYLLLMADFDNYRKRTLQEKAELIKNGSARAMEQLLPVVDDFERALEAIAKGGDIDSLKEGVELIYNKFVKYLKQQNVEPIESTGEMFDTDVHEAVTTFPVEDETKKGRVIDTVMKGYKINDKVLRHAKVVVGA